MALLRHLLLASSRLRLPHGREQKGHLCFSTSYALCRWRWAGYDSDAALVGPVGDRGDLSTDGSSKKLLASVERGYASGRGGSEPGGDAAHPGLHMSPVVKKLWDVRRAHPDKDLAKPPPTSLVTKTPDESRVEVDYKFSTDHELRERYRNPWGFVRFGKLMEDLDALAGTVAYQHCSDNDPNTRPLVLVTASVDRIVMGRRLNLEKDLRLSAKVTWVGRSSMEIRIQLDQDLATGSSQGSGGGPLAPALVAHFTFVARDVVTNAAQPINGLQPQTDEEKALFAVAEAKDLKRKQERSRQKAAGSEAVVDSSSVEKRAAALAEGRILKELPALGDRNSMLIQDTRMENAFLCQQQQRNMHGRIFGGFLMRRAFELAFSTAYCFSGTRPIFLEVDDITFQRPVDVGDLLRLKSCVLYTEHSDAFQPRIHVEVVALVTQPELRSSQVSNTFNFTFTVDPADVRKHGTTIRRVLPATDEEATRFIRRLVAHRERSLQGS